MLEGFSRNAIREKAVAKVREAKGRFPEAGAAKIAEVVCDSIGGHPVRGGSEFDMALRLGQIPPRETLERLAEAIVSAVREAIQLEADRDLLWDTTGVGRALLSWKETWLDTRLTSFGIRDTRNQEPDADVESTKPVPEAGEAKRPPPRPEVSASALAEQRLPKLNSFTELEIRFTSDERVQLFWNGHQETRNFIELGFEDERAKEKPVQAWHTLRELAQSQGVLRRSMGRQATRLEKRIGEIRRRLRKFFQTKDDPFEFNRRERFYKARFRATSADPTRF